MVVDMVTTTGRGASVVVLEGALADTHEADDIADRVLGRFPVDRPLVVDLSALRVEDRDDLAWLILRLEAAPGWQRFRLVDDRLTSRRRLREICRRLPILPDVDTAMSIVQAEAAAPAVAEVVDVRGGADEQPEAEDLVAGS